MAEEQNKILVTGVRTKHGISPIDYNALENKPNLPQRDTTLTKSESFADAKAVGDKISEVSASVTAVENNLANVSKNVETLSDSVANIAESLTPDAIGAAPSGYGLGKSQAITWDAVDTTTTPGWYHIDGEYTITSYQDDLIADSVTANNWYMYIIAYSDGANHCTQILYPVGVTSCLHRIRTNGEFSTWQRALELSDLDDTVRIINDNLNAKADAEHTHNYLPLAGGTLTGETTAASVDIDKSCLRNISAGTAEMVNKTTELATGAIYIQYE